MTQTLRNAVWLSEILKLDDTKVKTAELPIHTSLGDINNLIKLMRAYLLGTNTAVQHAVVQNHFALSNNTRQLLATKIPVKIQHGKTIHFDLDATHSKEDYALMLRNIWVMYDGLANEWKVKVVVINPQSVVHYFELTNQLALKAIELLGYGKFRTSTINTSI